MLPITIFTPTYNRAKLLPRLYESLCAQTCKKFEWIVVDDGSKDNTREVVEQFMEYSIFPIRYLFQNNCGKHKAVNRGVSLAKGELFFILDSDDWLPINSIELVLGFFDNVRNDVSFAGVCGLDIFAEGTIVGGGLPMDMIDCNSFDIRYKYNVKGDMKEVFRTSVLREIPFPEFEDEKFCPEVLCWNRIAQKYKLRYFNKPIYCCEYQSEGLSANIVRIRHFSPLASMSTYSDLYHAPIPFKDRLKSAINYWRFTPLKYYNQTIRMQMFNVFSFFSLPLGVVMRLHDKRYL